MDLMEETFPRGLRSSVLSEKKEYTMIIFKVTKVITEM